MLALIIMIKCPRCGFEQPEDVFCASCGVNMQTYKRRRAGPNVGLIILGVAALALVGLVANKLTQTLDTVTKSTTFATKALDDVGKELEDQPRNSEPVAVGSAPRTAPRNDALRAGVVGIRRTLDPSQPAQQAGGPNTPATGAMERGAPSAAATPEAKISNQVTVEFVLLSKEGIQKLNLSVGPPGSALVPRATYLEALKEAGSQNLSSESHAMSAGQTVNIIQGGQEPRTKENIGFNMRIAATRLTEQAADLRIQIRRALPDVSPTGDVRVASQDFQEVMTLPAGQVFAISGLLPRKNLMPNEETLYTTNVLRALLDPAFKNFESEFVIFISP